MAAKKAPTRKQLAARAKFTRMVKARAKEAAAAKRKAGYKLRGGKWVAPKVKRVATKRPAAKRRHNPRVKVASGLTVRKGGRRLYGAAAAAVLAKRGASKKGKRNSTLLSGRKGKRNGDDYSYIIKTGGAASSWFGYYKDREDAQEAMRRIRRSHPHYKTLKIQKVVQTGAGSKGHREVNPQRNGVIRSAIRSAVSKRLTQPIRLRRKRNSAPGAINDVHKMFLGRDSEHTFNVTAPSDTPKDVAVLGGLVCLKTEDERFDFEKGEAWIATDGQAKKLYILGDGYQGEVDANGNFGHIEEIRYEARKDHLNPLRWRRRRRNGQVTEYFHYFGEEDGRQPTLKSDSDGLLHISGGNYKIETEGIIN